MKSKVEAVKLNNFVNFKLNESSEDAKSQNQNKDFNEEIIELTKLLAGLKQCLRLEDCNRLNIPEPTILITNTDDEVFNPEQVLQCTTMYDFHNSTDFFVNPSFLPFCTQKAH